MYSICSAPHGENIRHNNYSGLLLIKSALHWENGHHSNYNGLLFHCAPHFRNGRHFSYNGSYTVVAPFFYIAPHNDCHHNYNGLVFSFYSAPQWGNDRLFNFQMDPFLVFKVHHNEEMTAFSIQMDPFLVFTVHHKEECTQMRKLQTFNYIGLLFSFYSAPQWGMHQNEGMTDFTIIMASFLVFTVHYNEEMASITIIGSPFLQNAKRRKWRTLQL